MWLINLYNFTAPPSIVDDRFVVLITIAVVALALVTTLWNWFVFFKFNEHPQNYSRVIEPPVNAARHPSSSVQFLNVVRWLISQMITTVSLTDPVVVVLFYKLLQFNLCNWHAHLHHCYQISWEDDHVDCYRWICYRSVSRLTLRHVLLAVRTKFSDSNSSAIDIVS